MNQSFSGVCNRLSASGVNLCIKNLGHTIDDEKLRKEFSPFDFNTSAKVFDTEVWGLKTKFIIPEVYCIHFIEGIGSKFCSFLRVATTLA